MSDLQWSCNEFSCNIDDNIEDIHEIICIDLGKTRLYPESAKVLNQFNTNNNPESERRKLLLHLFLDLVEQCTVVKKNGLFSDKKKNLQKKRKKENKKKKKPNDETVIDQNNDELSESEAEVVEEYEEHEEITSDGESEVRSQSNSVPRPIQEDITIDSSVTTPVVEETENSYDRSSKIALYYENILSKNDPNKVLDIRFWFISFSSSKKKIIQRTWATMIQDYFDRNNFKGVTSKKWVPLGYPGNHIRSKRDLASLSDKRFDNTTVSDKLGEIESTAIFFDSNPIGASLFFNPKTAFDRRVPCKIDSEQSYFGNYIKFSEATKTYSLSFPKKDFVYKIPPSDMRREYILGKLMQEHQTNSFYLLLDLLPQALAKPKIGNLDLDEEELDDEQIVDWDKDRAFNAMMGLSNFDMNHSTIRRISEGTEELLEPIDKSKQDELKKFLADPATSYFHINSYVAVKDWVENNTAQILDNLSKSLNGEGSWSFLQHPEMVAQKCILFVKHMALKTYESQCRDLSSNISPSGKKILSYVEREHLYKTNDVIFDKIDPSIDFFGTSEIRGYEFAESIYKICSNHSIYRLADKFSYDAYNMNINRCHNSMLVRGERGEEGKSFFFLKVKEGKIPGTFETVTYASLKADATDLVNNNDRIHYYDEFDMTNVENKSSGEQERMRFQKAVMSSNVVTSRTLQIDEKTKKRYTKETLSYCITVFLGNTNNKVLGSMDRAMETRWHLMTIDERLVPTRNVMDVEMSDSLYQEEEKSKRDKLNRHLMRNQALVFELEKIIYCGAITEVSMHIPMVIMTFVSNELQKRGLNQPSPRQNTRLMALIRFNCIQNAIDCLWFNRGAPFVGKEIKIQDFRHLEGMLFANCHHTVSAIGECIDLFGNPAESDIKRALRKLWLDEMDGTKSNYWESKSMLNPKRGQPILDPITKQPLIDKETKKQILEPEFKWINNYSWCRIPLKTTMRNLADRIRNKFEDLVPAPSIKHGVDVIVRVLSEWTKRKFNSYKYVEDPIDPTKAKAFMYEDNDPEKLLLNPEVFSVSKIIPNANYYFVHYGFLIDGEDRMSIENVMEEILQDLFSKKGQNPHRFLWTPNSTRPQLRNVLDIEGQTKKDAKYINIPSAIFMSKMQKHILKSIGNYGNDSKRNVKSSVIDTDLDSWGLNQRNDILKIKKRRIDPKFINENYLEDLLSVRSDDAVLTEEEKKKGYFMGKSVALLNERYQKTGSSITVSKQREILEKLDRYEPDEINGDYCFEKEFFKCPDGKYHWEILAIDEYNNLKKNNLQLSREELLKLRNETSSFKVVLIDDNEDWTEKDFKFELKKCDYQNMLHYKTICYHPKIMDLFFNLWIPEESKKFNFPDDMGTVKKRKPNGKDTIKEQKIKTRTTIWNKAQQMNFDEGKIAKEIAEKKRIFYAHEIEEGQAIVKPRNRYAFVSNALKGQIEGQRRFIQRRNQGKKKQIDEKKAQIEKKRLQEEEGTPISLDKEGEEKLKKNKTKKSKKQTKTDLFESTVLNTSDSSSIFSI